MTPNVPACFYRVGIMALILDETRKKFLIARKESGYWSLLGGGLEWGESVEQCLERELQEEAGFEIVTFNPGPGYVIYGKRHDGVWAMNLVHEVIVKDLNFTPSNECTEIKFVTAQEVKNLEANSGLEKFAQVFDSAIHKMVRKTSRTQFEE